MLHFGFERQKKICFSKAIVRTKKIVSAEKNGAYLLTENIFAADPDLD